MNDEERDPDAPAEDTDDIRDVDETPDVEDDELSPDADEEAGYSEIPEDTADGEEVEMMSEAEETAELDDEDEPAADLEEDEIEAEPEEDAVAETEPAEEEEADEPAEEDLEAEIAAAEEEPSPEPEEPEEAAESDGEAEEQPTNHRWYAVKVQSGRETTIRQALERRVRIDNLEEYIGRILIPTEKQTILRRTKTKTKDGEEKVKEKRVTKEVKKYPGYLFVEVEFNDQVLYLFRETSGVGDFVGGSFNRVPSPLTDREVQRMLGEAGLKPIVDGETVEPELVFEFGIGDRVKIRDGAFKDQEGEVKEILPAKDEKDTTKVKVELTIFGRPVPVEIEPWHVEVL